ncbi:hypothetical protein SCMU_29160 [Sinomonas cyclohexanicum]|uniref:Uncharacterized protein n=1 Tax=Sinomonas cyclohexanicum TaxID=322009 RepID=A0ABM7PYE4_SINCY|nr:hypothetical protein SCMU_29160 [Corynebacterium cyclohexanicum]
MIRQGAIGCRPNLVRVEWNNPVSTGLNCQARYIGHRTCLMVGIAAILTDKHARFLRCEISEKLVGSVSGLMVDRYDTVGTFP